MDLSSEICFFFSCVAKDQELIQSGPDVIFFHAQLRLCLNFIIE